jgi:serine protease Do
MRYRMNIRWTVAVTLAAGVLASSAADATAQTPGGRLDPLLQLNGSVESLVHRVSQSVVQVVVTSYGPVDKSRTDADLVLGRQRSLGSGVAIGADGFIVTNAHVVSNAKRVQVILPGPADLADRRTAARSRTVDAIIVGTAPEIDLALLKANDTTLPPLPLATYDSVHQGELVFAFGSPEGLRNSVTMGIVSAVARQRDPDNPMVYVQTDAPINHGSSGGPLVNVKGELVGINTFILSDSRGSQGMGFAIPAALVNIAYPKLRTFGHLHRGEVGVLLQTVTPLLAEGLKLAQDWGAMISDVAPGSAAEHAGLKVKDIILQIDDTPVDSVPTMAFELFTRSAGDTIRLQVLRGRETLTYYVGVAERAHDVDRLSDLVEPDTSLVTKLGIFGVPLDKDNARLAVTSRAPFGVVVVGHSQDEGDRPDTGLMTGDVIHTVNDAVVNSVPELSAALDTLQPRSAVVLHVERNGQLIFLPFELE